MISGVDGVPGAVVALGLLASTATGFMGIAVVLAPPDAERPSGKAGVHPVATCGASYARRIWLRQRLHVQQAGPEGARSHQP